LGAVLRVVVPFDPVLRERYPLLSRAVFVQEPGAPFPVCWTIQPLATPALVAWAGGPPAAALLSRGDVEIAQLARERVAAAFGIAPLDHKHLGAPRWHDWERDPFTLGAYSYATLGARDAPVTLGEPVEDTLFFAGEHTSRSCCGTVHGALLSGRRAARQVLTSTARTVERHARG
jgi:monoamine oxidase